MQEKFGCLLIDEDLLVINRLLLIFDLFDFDISCDFEENQLVFKEFQVFVVMKNEYVNVFQQLLLFKDFVSYFKIFGNFMGYDL